MFNVAGQYKLIWSVLFCVLSAGVGAQAYDVRDYEEDAGISLVGFRDPDGDVYGGGFESGVWLKGTPVFGEMFGHWLANRLQNGNYYSVGMSLRIMPPSAIAPFAGGGGSYNGLTSHRSDRWRDDPEQREADRSYWQGHAEGGLRIWYGPQRARFVEGTYRYHWSSKGSPFNYGWISIELGQRF